MNKIGTVILVVLSVLYPGVVFIGLVCFKTSPRVLSLAIIVIALLNFISATNKRRVEGQPFSPKKLILPLVLGVLIIAIFITNSDRLLKLYPIIINGSFLLTFSYTLIRSPSMILRFASLQDKKLKDNADYAGIVIYCRTVTFIWCGFFIFNILVASYLTFYASDFAWSLYNGLISYILIGILVTGEMVVRRLVQKK